MNGFVNAEAEQRIRMLESQNMAMNIELERERGEKLRLQRIVEGLNPNDTSSTSSKGAEQRIRQLERDLEIERLRNIEIQTHLKEVAFRERVLLAMCTISEGDYVRLCEEAGIDPRDVETNASLLSSMDHSTNSSSSQRSKRVNSGQEYQEYRPNREPDHQRYNNNRDQHYGQSQNGSNNNTKSKSSSRPTPTQYQSDDYSYAQRR